MNGEILDHFQCGVGPGQTPRQNRRRVPFSTRTLFQILNAKDQQELRHRVAFWPAAFQPVALDLLTGLQSTGFLKSQSTHYLKMWQQNAKVYWLTENDNRRLRIRLGAPKAITAMGHRLARLVYRM